MSSLISRPRQVFDAQEAVAAAKAAARASRKRRRAAKDTGSKSDGTSTAVDVPEPTAAAEASGAPEASRPHALDGVAAEGHTAAVVAPGARGQAASRTQGHRAGFDAFMTGYAYLAAKTDGSFFAAHVNKVYLGGKDRPLGLVKSAYTNYSVAHQEQQRQRRKEAKVAVKEA